MSREWRRSSGCLHAAAAGAALLFLTLALPLVARAEDGAANPYEGDAGRALQGKSLFNQYCSHCHGPSAVSPDPPRDLRRLKLRYGDEMAKVFRTTVTHGRPDKGMPNWSGTLDDQTLWTVFTFLETVQSGQ